MMLEKDAEDELDRSCEKWSIENAQGEEEYSTSMKQKEGKLGRSHIV
jgi:hypothetical protein